VTVNTWLVFLLLSLFAWRLTMFTYVGCEYTAESETTDEHKGDVYHRMFRKSTNTVSFIKTEGVELFQIGRDKTGSYTYDTVHIKEFVWHSISSFCFSFRDTNSSRVSAVTCFSAQVNSFIRSSCNLSRWLLIFVLRSCISFSIIRFCSLTELGETFPKSYHDTNRGISEIAVVCAGK
jgi:hypothetical protein